MGSGLSSLLRGGKSAATAAATGVKNVAGTQMLASGAAGAVQGGTNLIKEAVKRARTSNFAGKHLATIRNSMYDLGPQGKQVADDLLQIEVARDIRMVPLEAKIRSQFSQLPEADKKAVIDWLDAGSLKHKGLKTGAAPRLTKKQLELAKSFHSILATGSDEARALGLQVHTKGKSFSIGKEDYPFFPNQLNPNITAKQMDYHAQRMVEEGTVGDIVQAKKLLQDRLQGRNYIFGPQERGRLVNPTGYDDRLALGYKTDPYDVAINHLFHKFDTLELVKKYGLPAKGSDYPPALQKIFKDMDAVNPGSGEKLSGLYRAQMGLDKAPYSRAVLEIKAATNLISLFGLPIQQAFEIVSAMPDAGIAKVLTTTFKVAKSPALRAKGTPASIFSRIAHKGQQASPLGQDIEATGAFGHLFTKTIGKPISAMDRFSRDVAFLSFRDALEAAAKATSRTAKQTELLKRSGFTGAATEEALDKAAATLVMQQFPGTARGSHIAGALTGNISKLTQMYQAYAFDRAREIMRMASTPERIVGLAKLLAGYAASGKMQMEMKELVGIDLPVPEEGNAEHWARAIRMGSFTPYQLRVLQSIEREDLERLIIGAALAKGSQVAESLGKGEGIKAFTHVMPVGGQALRRALIPNRKDVSTSRKIARESGNKEDIERYLNMKRKNREQKKERKREREGR